MTANIIRAPVASALIAQGVNCIPPIPGGCHIVSQVGSHVLFAIDGKYLKFQSKSGAIMHLKQIKPIWAQLTGKEVVPSGMTARTKDMWQRMRWMAGTPCGGKPLSAYFWLRERSRLSSPFGEITFGLYVTSMYRGMNSGLQPRQSRECAK